MERRHADRVLRLSEVAVVVTGIALRRLRAGSVEIRMATVAAHRVLNSTCASRSCVARPLAAEIPEEAIARRAMVDLAERPATVDPARRRPATAVRTAHLATVAGAMLPAAVGTHRAVAEAAVIQVVAVVEATPVVVAATPAAVIAKLRKRQPASSVNELM